MSLRILVVDDDADGREAMGALLRLAGYRPYLADTGARASHLAASHPPDIVILDLGLPGMSGTALCEALKATRAAPFVIAYTGYHRLEGEARAAGCDAFVLKPALDELMVLLAERPPGTKKASGNDR